MGFDNNSFYNQENKMFSLYFYYDDIPNNFNGSKLDAAIFKTRFVLLLLLLLLSFLLLSSTQSK